MALHERKILAAVTRAAERLLAATDWTSVVVDVMAGLGEAANVSRVVAFRRSDDTEGEIFITQVFEWAGPGLTVRVEDPTITGIPLFAAGFARWAAALDNGQVVSGNVCDLPPAERDRLDLQCIRSFVVVPIPVQGTWWGFLAFEDCASERNWLPEEINALQAAANILGGAIRRKATDDREAGLESQIRHLQKMEAVGQLAGGVAHDFNNILTAVMGYCDLLQGVPTLDADAHSWINEISKASERAASLTRQLLTFSRQQVVQPAIFDLNTTVAELQKMLRRLIGEHVRLVMVHAEASCDIYADPGQLEQVIVNLAVNARDAMPHGGTIGIEVRRAGALERPSGWSGDVNGEHVLLVISDTGSGMSDDVKAHMFEPFFTTKPVGWGTGLGLSTVYGIVQQAGGTITFSSDEGTGTTFRIHLPLATQTETAVVDPITRASGGCETVLLVEDEPSVRQIASLFLKKLGYSVIEAHDGGSALRVASAHQGALDLLLTDMVMPVASGKEVADRLAGVHPEARVLFMSGYTDGDISHDGELDHGATFLQKPFTFESLARAVRTALA